jgi:hypothetical protein
MHEDSFADARMNFYLFLADVLVVIHFAYVLFVVLGMAAILAGIVFRWSWVRNFWFRSIHFLMIAVVVFETLFGIICPLTEWEDRLREAGGMPVESESFIGRCVQSIMFFHAPLLLPVCYCIFGLLVLLTLIFAPPRWPRRRHCSPGEGDGGGCRKES